MKVSYTTPAENAPRPADDVRKAIPSRACSMPFDRVWVIAGALSLLLTTGLIACQIPVFRYALERWPADRYDIVILHDRPLSGEEQANIDRLREANHTSVLGGNFDVRSLPVKEVQDPHLRNAWSEHGQSDQPLMVVLYPLNAQDLPHRVASSTPLSRDAVENLVDSPVRQEIAKNLLAGDSAVWIFVPSGKSDPDATAKRSLSEHVQTNQENLELPPQEEEESEDDFLQATDLELRIGFSVVTLDREDPRERFLLEMLMGSESDLRSLDQPMAFPVLGRGRVLYALVGEGISSQTIGLASRFIVGPCSCQVKEQNPGFDLLMSVNWDEQLGVSTAGASVPGAPVEPVLIQIPPGRTNRLATP